MKNLVSQLAILAPFNHRLSHQSAARLLARQYVLENPTGGPEIADAEMAALYAADADAGH